MADFRFILRQVDADGSAHLAGGLDRISLDERGRRDLCRVTLTLPRTAVPLRWSWTAALSPATEPSSATTGSSGSILIGRRNSPRYRQPSRSTDSIFRAIRRCAPPAR
jgi:hypothetical protein